MQLAQKKYNPFGSMATLAFVLTLAYFSYHVVSGERGLLSLMELTKQVEESRRQLDITSVERLRLEHKVSLLRDESLDLDLLDEQARRILGYTGKNEITYTDIGQSH